MFDVSGVPESVCWIALLLDIPLWFTAYYYCDSVMKSTYGISKDPLFCLKRKHKIQSSTG